MITKSIWKSKTFWLAVSQGIISLIVIFTTSFPEGGWVGYALLIKSFLDGYIRTQTSLPLE